MADVKRAFSALVGEVNTAARSFLVKRGTYTHVFAFVLGALFCIVTLRVMAGPTAEAAEPEAIAAPAAAVAEAPAPAIDTDAESVARVLYGVREYGLSENAKTAIIEVIKNRVADTAREFRNIDTVTAACEQANQWQGYVSDGPYLREDYELALRVLNDTTAARTVPDGCYFLVVTQGAVIARTEWDGGNEWRVN